MEKKHTHRDAIQLRVVRPIIVPVERFLSDRNGCPDRRIVLLADGC